MNEIFANPYDNAVLIGSIVGPIFFGLCFALAYVQTKLQEK